LKLKASFVAWVGIVATNLLSGVVPFRPDNTGHRSPKRRRDACAQHADASGGALHRRCGFGTARECAPTGTAELLSKRPIMPLIISRAMRLHLR
jgi:hypothetical protein